MNIDHFRAAYEGCIWGTNASTDEVVNHSDPIARNTGSEMRSERIYKEVKFFRDPCGTEPHGAAIPIVINKRQMLSYLWRVHKTLNRGSL